MERQKEAYGYANASKLAAKLANDLKGLNSTARGFGIWLKYQVHLKRPLHHRLKHCNLKFF